MKQDNQVIWITSLSKLCCPSDLVGSYMTKLQQEYCFVKQEGPNQIVYSLYY